jgi:hypothetical protein
MAVGISFDGVVLIVGGDNVGIILLGYVVFGK